MNDHILIFKTDTVSETESSVFAECTCGWRDASKQFTTAYVADSSRSYEKLLLTKLHAHERTPVKVGDLRYIVGAPRVTHVEYAPSTVKLVRISKIRVTESNYPRKHKQTEFKYEVLTRDKSTGELEWSSGPNQYDSDPTMFFDGDFHAAKAELLQRRYDLHAKILQLVGESNAALEAVATMVDPKTLLETEKVAS